MHLFTKMSELNRFGWRKQEQEMIHEHRARSVHEHGPIVPTQKLQKTLFRCRPYSAKGSHRVRQDWRSAPTKFLIGISDIKHGPGKKPARYHVRRDLFKSRFYLNR